MIVTATPGTKLPSEPKLASRLGVARATLREAMRTFETQGLLYRRQGSGTYVSHPAHIIDSGLEVLESIERMAERLGLKVDMGALKVEHGLATTEESAALGLFNNQSVTRVTRTIRTDGHPAAYLVDVLPEDIVSTTDLEQGFTGSVLDLLLQRGTPPLASSRTAITAVTAPAEVARPLGIQRGDMLLRFEALLYSTAGRVVDYSFSYFLPGYFKFHVVRKVGGA